MHGLGADAYDLYSIPSQIGLPETLSIRHIFPNAPRMPVTINGGTVMRAWYDISGFDSRSQDEKRIRESAKSIECLIDRELTRGLSSEHVILAGFSQGGAMALFQGLRYPKLLGGIVCLSGYLPLFETTSNEISKVGRSVSIFQAHGTEDPVLPYEMGNRTSKFLTKVGCKIDWHEYPMGHQISSDELRDLGNWMADRLGTIHKTEYTEAP
jgi:phospholipase/carboxylesterase